MMIVEIHHRPESRNGLYLSIILHGVIGLVAVLLLRSHVADDTAPPDSKVELIDITPPPNQIILNQGPIVKDSPVPRAMGAPTKIVDPSQGRAGRRGHVAGRTPIPSTNPFADMTRSVDNGPNVGTGAIDHGVGPGKALYGNGYDGPPGNGIGGGMGGMGVPSLRRDPSPRMDYSASDTRFPEEYAGNTVIVALELDAAGHVKKADVVKSCGNEKIDAEIAKIIGAFEFFPALDDTGKAIASKYRWLWVLQPAT